MRDLTAELYLATLGDYQRAFVAHLRRAGDARDGVRRAVDFHVRWHATEPQAARFLHAAREPELRDDIAAPLRERNAEFFGAIRSWMAPHVKAGTLRELPVPTLHALWLGPAQELCRHWLAGSAPRPDRATRTLLADAAWRALTPLPLDTGDA